MTTAIQSLQLSPRAKAVDSLRRLLADGGLRRGDRLPAETKLATQFGISRMTLRMAMDELEQEGLIWRERNQGCFCGPTAESTSAPRGLMSRMIVLISDHASASTAELYNGYSASIVSGVIDKAHRSNQDFLRLAVDDNGDKWIAELLRSKVRGVIFSCWSKSIEWQLSLLTRLRKHGIPVVSWGDAKEFADFDRVSTDHVSGTTQLTQYLADAGCKNILRMWTQPAETPWIAAHNIGYDHAVAERGLASIAPLYVEDLPHRDDRNETEKNFRARVRHFAGYLAERFGNELPIDAIMVSTDCEAFVALAACRLFGRTDIRVTGYDNYWQGVPEREWESAPITATIDKSNHRLGEELVELLLERIGGSLSVEPQMRLIPQQLVVTA